MIDKRHLSAIRKIVDSSEWESFEAAIQVFKDIKKSQEVIGKNTFDTLKMTFMREGGLLAIDELVEFLEQGLLKR